ncbi:MAG: LysE family transporter [Bacteroidetes bacterium]|nr:LysE family transporter [Bacteroidota bacterium]
MHLAFVVLLGWLLSFLGQLPLGTMSMTSTQIAVQENFSNAWKYSIGVAIIEMLYLRIVLSGVDWIMQHQLFFLIIGWLTVLVFLVLGTLSFIAARKQQEDKKALLLNNNLNRFWLGASMSMLNPAQIPFWFIWSSYFLDIKLLNSYRVEFNLFTIGAGTGTLAGLAVYMYGGNWLVTKMNTSNKTLNKIMGVIFVIAALAQLYRMLYKQLLN